MIKICTLISCFLICNTSFSQFPLGKWQTESASKNGTIVREIFEFKPNNEVIYENIIRSESTSYTTRAVVKGTWTKIPFSTINLDEREKLTRIDPIFNEYYLIDKLETFQEISIQFNTLVSKFAQFDNTKIPSKDLENVLDKFSTMKMGFFVTQQQNRSELVQIPISKPPLKKVLFWKI